MKRGWMLALALLLSCDAAAQTVQKCVARDGHVRYQSTPCARGERVAEVWDATPDPVEPVEAFAPRRPRTRARGTARSARTTRVAASMRRSDRMSASTDACAEARAYRDAAERRAGLDRTYDLLATLQTRVFEACR